MVFSHGEKQAPAFKDGLYDSGKAPDLSIGGNSMRLTRQGEYAVRCILYLSARKIGKVVSRREIAAAMEIPEMFLGKIAQELARFGFIEIVQGAKGGYRLLMAPDKITLLDVVESAIGEIFLNDCVMNPASCRRSPFCSIHMVWEKARKQLRDTLREETFASLLSRENCLTGDIFAVGDAHDEPSFVDASSLEETLPAAETCRKE